MKLSLQAKLLALVLATALKTAVAPPPDGKGPPSPPETPEYGDLIKLYRDENGVPILTAPTDPEAVCLKATDGCCQQPLASADCPEDCYHDEGGVNVVNVADQELCAVDLACAICTMETDFGRTSVARTALQVFIDQLEEVKSSLYFSDCTPTLDPAGRPVHFQEDIDPGEYTAYTIDSPLQNLAMYMNIMKYGDLGGPAIPQGQDALITAARAIGASTDKGGEVDVDQIVYTNQIMGLVGESLLLPVPICIVVREEVVGLMMAVEKCFLDYSAFAYDRGTNFGELPLPPYIPEGDPQDGQFEYLQEVDPPTDPPTFTIEQGLIYDKVFDSTANTAKEKIGAFTQAADDARAVINFMHVWPVPEDHETHPGCEAVDGSFCEVSISALQVPKNIIAGADDREVIVTVANADGGVPATGSVTVTGSEMVADNVINDQTWLREFELDPGSTQQFLLEISAELTSDAGAEYIYWNAEVTVPVSSCINTSDEVEVEATSTIKATGGGGGHRFRGL